MIDRDAISRDFDRQIHETHDRFAAAMAARLPGMDLPQKERYFVVLSTLVGKLEDPARPMRQVLQECVAEVLPLVMEEITSS